MQWDLSYWLYREKLKIDQYSKFYNLCVNNVYKWIYYYLKIKNLYIYIHCEIYTT